MRPFILVSTLLGLCKAYSSFSMVPSLEYPPEHHYSIEHGPVLEIPHDEPRFYFDKHGGYEHPGHHPEFRTHIQHPTNGISHTYYNRIDNEIGKKFNFNVGKGTYNNKVFPIEYKRYTYIAPDGQLYVTNPDKEEERVPFKAPNMKQTSDQLFTGNKANRYSRPSTNFNRNLPRRTNQLGIPSAALASLAGGGLG